MNEGRGLLNIVSEGVLAYLMEFLPQQDPKSEWVPGELLTSHFVHRLERSGFTGFAHAKIKDNVVGAMIFYKGRLLEAWRRTKNDAETRGEAYRNLMPMLSKGGVALYNLSVEAVPAIVALTLSDQTESMVAEAMQPSTLETRLSLVEFTGAVVLENGSVGQAWFFHKGQRLFEPPFPDEFREGRLHVAHSPGQHTPKVLPVQEQGDEQDARLTMIF
jgi:hypothetical protein